MTGWNMPDGCTPLDVDRAMGCLTRCVSCGKEIYAGEDLNEDEEQICKSCDGDDAYDRMRDEKMEREYWAKQEQKP
jgi:hypothetical protein